MAARLAVAVLAAALLVALLEAAVLDVTVLQSPAGRPTATDRWHVVDVLAGGAVLVVPLALLLGGWRLARRPRPGAARAGGRRPHRRAARGGPSAPTSRTPCRAAADTRQPLTLALVELAGVHTAVHLLGRRRAEPLVCAAAATLGSATAAGPAVAPATYRLAGEVFAVVLPGVGTDAAFGVVDELLGQVARTAAPLSAGAGLATLDARCPDAQLLLVGASRRARRGAQPRRRPGRGLRRGGHRPALARDPGHPEAC